MLGAIIGDIVGSPALSSTTSIRQTSSCLHRNAHSQTTPFAQLPLQMLL